MQRLRHWLGPGARDEGASPGPSRLLSAVKWPIAFEFLLLALFAAWVGREYLAPDPNVVPTGREFLSAIQTHQFWLNVKSCGFCAFWNGSTAGGYPALGEIYGAPLHPLVGLFTSFWGISNGAKFSVIGILWSAGMAQWWLAREFRLGWFARVWSSLIAIAGGHLAGRMELGIYGVLLSTAMASLVLPAILAIDRRQGDARSVVLLGLTGALWLVSGQGYMQVGLAFTLPAFAILLLETDLTVRPIWRGYLKGGLLAILLAAPLLVPVARFLPQTTKFWDAGFTSLQPLKYLPLNLVIDDPAYYYSGDVLGKLPYPNLYNHYIGWPAVLLAVAGLAWAEPKDRRRLHFLAVSVVIVFLTASGMPLRLLARIYPPGAGIRYASLIAGLAVPMILALAAYGLDYLMKLEWPRLSLQYSGLASDKPLGLSLRWGLVILLVLALRANAQFAAGWFDTTEHHENVFAVLNALETEDSQWVETPFGEHFYVTPAIERGMKLVWSVLPWDWEDRSLPVGTKVATHSEVPTEPGMTLVERVADVGVYGRAETHYAAVDHQGKSTPCRAQARGGWIEVGCAAEEEGVLVVREHMYHGWRARRDGERIPLQNAEWLVVEAPAGSHQYRFRYLPWDALAGFGLFGLGVALAVRWLWLERQGSQTQRTEAELISERGGDASLVE